MDVNLTLAFIAAIVVCQIMMLVYYVRSVRDQKPLIKEQISAEDSWDLIHSAQKKSEAMVANAELEGIRHSAEIDQILRSGVARAGEEFKSDLLDQKKHLEELSETETKKFLSELRGILEKNIFQIQDGFAKDLASYKTQRKQAIDQNGEEIVNRAVELYLGKGIDRNQHMQLVFESLERARKELES